MNSRSLPSTCASHDLDARETAAYATIEGLLDYLKGELTNGFHVVRIDRHEWRRLVNLFPYQDQEPRFCGGYSLRNSHGVVHIIIEAI